MSSLWEPLTLLKGSTCQVNPQTKLERNTITGLSRWPGQGSCSHLVGCWDPKLRPRLSQKKVLVWVGQTGLNYIREGKLVEVG